MTSRDKLLELVESLPEEQADELPRLVTERYPHPSTEISGWLTVELPAASRSPNQSIGIKDLVPDSL